MTYEVVLNALADPTRRDILESLRASPRSVAELAEGRPVSRPAVSQHLKVLESAGLVSIEQKGVRRIYSVRPEGLAALRAYLDDFWGAALSAFADEVNRNHGDEND
jgi:DNA-binding transcriptional ArsR family regulator